MDILTGLNPSQRKAVMTTEGYVRVIAGAGSGKTRALTHRYAYLVEELGISPSNILCITFTNKAAAEMKKRVKSMLGASFDTSFVNTLHAFCTRILREDITKLFYPQNFIVLDNVDQKKILEEVYEELGIKMDTASFKFMIDKIRYEKNLITYVEYLSNPDFDYTTLHTDDITMQIIYRYIQKQRKYFGLDFFDLINFVIYLFRIHPDILEKWQERLAYVMVDEFQDITAKEFKLIRRLTEKHHNLFVVGDPDQNIYEWRGANLSVLCDFNEWLNNPCFEHQFTPALSAADIVLAQNYRSTTPILTAANRLIEKNQNRVEKSLFTDQTDGEKPVWVHAKTDKDEGKFLTDTIKAHKQAGGTYADIAVLYRSSHMSRFAEQALLSENIPYTVFGGVGFYERMEIKDVLSYLRLCDNPDDDLSFQRIINVPRRKMGKFKLASIRMRAMQDGCSLYTAAKHMTEEKSSLLRGSGAADFITLMETMREAAKTMSVSELLQKILKDSGYELYIRESGDIERLDNVTELLRAIVTEEEAFGELLTLTDFLHSVTLLRDTDADDKTDCVRLMTIHSSKGLEFDTVILVGMTEGMFPSARSLEERKEAAMEEERRLCFVAMTRAKRQLYFTESEGWGVKGYQKVPSRFLLDIGEDAIMHVGKIPDVLLVELDEQIRIFDKKTEIRYQVGDQLRHKVFGEGIVEAVDEKTRTYYIRFVSGTKPISFSYQGLAHIFE